MTFQTIPACSIATETETEKFNATEITKQYAFARSFCIRMQHSECKKPKTLWVLLRATPTKRDRALEQTIEIYARNQPELLCNRYATGFTTISKCKFFLP